MAGDFLAAFFLGDFLEAVFFGDMGATAFSEDLGAVFLAATFLAGAAFLTAVFLAGAAFLATTGFCMADFFAGILRAGTVVRLCNSDRTRSGRHRQAASRMQPAPGFTHGTPPNQLFLGCERARAWHGARVDPGAVR